MAAADPEFLSAEDCLAHAEKCERKARSLSVEHELRRVWLEVAAQWILLARDSEDRAKA
jgi:hypothetical protein